MKSIFVFLAFFFIAGTSIAQSPQPLWVRTGHLGGVTNLIFTPDGKHFISSALADSRILVWNTATGNYERSIIIPDFRGSQLYEGQSFSLTLSPDGGTIAYSGDTLIYLLDFTTGQIEDSIVPFTGGVSLLQFSETGDTLVWIGDGSFCRLNLSSRKLVDTLPASSFPVPSRYEFLRPPQMAVSADTKVLAYVYSEDTVAFVSLDRSETTKLFYAHFASSIATNQNGSELAIGGSTPEIINASTGAVIYTWPDTVSLDNLCYLGYSDTIFFYADTGFWIHVPNGSTDLFTPIAGPPAWSGAALMALSPDRSTLIEARSVGSAPVVTPVASAISIYRKPNFNQMEVTGTCGAITQLRWSPITDSLMASDMGGGLHCYQALDGILSIDQGPLPTRIGGFDYFANSDSIAFSAFDDDDLENSYAGIWVPSGQVISFPSFGSDLFYQGLILSPNGKHFVFDGIYDTASGTVWIPFQKHTDVFAFVPDGSVLLAEDTFGNLATMSAQTMNTTELSDPNTSGILGASFAPNGNEIAVIQIDQSVEVLSYPSCAEIYRLQGHTATVTGAIFSKNSRYLITSSLDSTMRVWDLASGKSIFTYSYSTPLYTAGFSYDQKYVAASDGGTSVIVWNAPSNLKVEEQSVASQTMQIQNSPNPVIDEMKIIYSVPYSEEVSIKLYDVLGNQVVQIESGVVASGEHTISIGPGTIRKLAPGIYYYRIEAASGVATGKMVVE